MQINQTTFSTKLKAIFKRRKINLLNFYFQIAHSTEEDEKNMFLYI